MYLHVVDNGHSIFGVIKIHHAEKIKNKGTHKRDDSTNMTDNCYPRHEKRLKYRFLLSEYSNLFSHCCPDRFL